MALTKKKERKLQRMPIIETQFSKSKDGNYIVHKTIITTIRRVEYFEKIIEDEGTLSEDEIQKTLAEDDVQVVQGASLAQ